MAMVAVNGAQLYYELAGTSGAPLVLVHGSWGDHHNWGTVVPMLAESCRVLTFDRRGHSRSARGVGAGTMDQDALDLAGLLEALDLAPAHVVGNSFGASVALRLACTRPELFRSLTAHEPPLFALLAGDAGAQATLESMQERVAAVVRLLQRGEARDGARLFVETIAFGPGAWERLPERARQTFTANAPTFLEEIADPDWAGVDLDRLRRFARPVLLTRGDRSPSYFSAIVDRIARALPHAAQHLFVGAGHVPHLEQPAAYADIVARFAAGTADRGEPSARVATPRAEPRPSSG